MNRQPCDDDTLELLGDCPWTDTGSAQVAVEFAAVSHAGRVRTSNEDHYLIMRFARSAKTMMTNLPSPQVRARVDEVGYGLIVADGIGGNPGGEVASQMVVTTLISLALGTPDWIFSTEEAELNEVMRRMAHRFQRVQEALRAQGQRDGSLQRMGTTMCVALSLGANLIVGHIGNSRVYLFRDGRLNQLTRDHTQVQSMVDLGRLTPEQAAVHPRRHVLTRSFFAGTNTLEPDFQLTTLMSGDQLLLCSDGLTEMVRDDDIGSILSNPGSADEACNLLLDASLNNGGKDNVTAVLARYRIPS